MGAARRSPRAAKAKRARRKIQLPARYSKDYPVSSGHDYRLRSVPVPTWKRATKRALAEERSIRVVLIRALEEYAAGRFNP